VARGGRADARRKMTSCAMMRYGTEMNVWQLVTAMKKA